VKSCNAKNDLLKSFLPTVGVVNWFTVDDVTGDDVTVDDVTVDDVTVDDVTVDDVTIDDVGEIFMRLDLVGAIGVLQTAGIATYDVIHFVIVSTTTEVITFAGTSEGFVSWLVL
jgi:hypothetical protein